MVRERFFTPRLGVKSLDELDGWLIDKCIAYAKAHRHPEQTEQIIWQVFEEERGSLVYYVGPFRQQQILSSLDAVGRPVEVHAYADRIVIWQDRVNVGEHQRCFGRDETAYNPWHYVPVLARKPGALRNGAPFRDWALPPAMEKVRKRLKGVHDGDRQMVTILACVPTDGLVAVDATCQEALDHGVCSASVIINILARSRDLAQAATLQTPDALRLTHEPVADCAIYDRLRRTS